VPPGAGASPARSGPPRALADAGRVAERSPALEPVVAAPALEPVVAAPARTVPISAPPPRPLPPGAAPSAAQGGDARVQPEPALADEPPPPRPRQPLDLNRLAEHWDDVVEAVRAAGRGVIASALAEAAPTAVTASGLVTISVTGEALADAIRGGNDAILAALRSVFDGPERISVKAAPDREAGPRRLTAEDVMATRVAELRRRDPQLHAAIDALDLRLIE